MPKFLMFSGSTRQASYNKKLIDTARYYVESQGGEVTLIDLDDYPMAIYNGDDEEREGVPEHAKRLHDLIQSHDAFVIASPEYNGLPSPLLKNTIDWISRVDVKVFGGKYAAIMSTSPGALGGIRGLVHLRALLTNLNVIVLPQQVCVGNAGSAFDEAGKLANDAKQQMLQSVLDQLMAISK